MTTTTIPDIEAIQASARRLVTHVRDTLLNGRDLAGWEYRRGLHDGVMRLEMLLLPAPSTSTPNILDPSSVSSVGAVPVAALPLTTERER